MTRAVSLLSAESQQQSGTFYADQYPGLQALYRNVGSASSHSLLSPSGSKNGRSGASTSGTRNAQPRLWYVFDHTALLPEYIITYQLSTDAPDEAAAAHAQDCSSSSNARYMYTDSSGCKDALLRLCAQPISRWLCNADQQAEVDLSSRDLQQHCTAALAAVTPAPCPRLPALTSLGLTVAAGGKQVTGCFALLAAAKPPFARLQPMLFCHHASSACLFCCAPVCSWMP
jgi:hypothetical protein